MQGSARSGHGARGRAPAPVAPTRAACDAARRCKAGHAPFDAPPPDRTVRALAGSRALSASVTLRGFRWRQFGPRWAWTLFFVEGGKLVPGVAGCVLAGAGVTCDRVRQKARGQIFGSHAESLASRAVLFVLAPHARPFGGSSCLGMAALAFTSQLFHVRAWLGGALRILLGSHGGPPFQSRMPAMHVPSLDNAPCERCRDPGDCGAIESVTRLAPGVSRRSIWT